ncbi:MAG: MazG-like family protein [Candidatus Woesebacteria bacterium]|jgi:NTP pyrophosphatase (non-canonical NTP hydrolase)
MSKNDLKKMLRAVKRVTQERGWEKYHTPKNMAMDLVREASEALEHCIWQTDQEIKKDKKRVDEIKDEMGDVLHALLLLSDSLDADLADCFWHKLEKTEKKYPPEQALKFTVETIKKLRKK